MPRSAHVRPLAEQDTRDTLSYLTRTSPTAVERFREAFQYTVSVLLDLPKIGSTRVSDRPALRDIRVIPVRGFEAYAIFYCAHEDTVDIIRVLHTARDYPSLFT